MMVVVIKIMMLMFFDRKYNKKDFVIQTGSITLPALMGLKN